MTAKTDRPWDMLPKEAEESHFSEVFKHMIDSYPTEQQYLFNFHSK